MKKNRGKYSFIGRQILKKLKTKLFLFFYFLLTALSLIINEI
jgi:cell division protein FtsL